MVAVEQISMAVTTILAPFAPYLVEGGKKFAGKAGEAAWIQAQKIWTFISSRDRDGAKLTPAARLLSIDGNSAAYRSAFAEALRSKLHSDPTLARELCEILGGDHGIQELIATEGGSIENATQQMEKAGRQSQKATKGSIKNSRQKM